MQEEHSIEKSIIGACHDVNEMRAGKMREKPIDEFLTELKSMIEEEKSHASYGDAAFRGGRQVLR
ncbi:MAG: hypothetical protein IJL14_03940 [Selenomonadaceae bacterium]|nr:hypothetical protein [Selenomonadaceae bacterium]MBR0288030.1 hypothetical protein [Selenomonadaceae bacterium]